MKNFFYKYRLIELSLAILGCIFFNMVVVQADQTTETITEGAGNTGIVKDDKVSETNSKVPGYIIGCENLVGPGSCDPEKAGTTDAEASVEKSFALTTFIPQVLKALLSILAAVALGFLIYSGWEYVVAMGDDTMYTEAKKSIIYSIVGLAVALLSYAIVDIISSISSDLGS